MADILFLMRMPMDGRDNLHAKFIGQIHGAQRLGHKVHWIGWDHEGMWLCGDGEPRLLHKNRLAKLPAYHHTFLYVDLFSALQKLSREQTYDLVYMRYMPTFFNAPKALRLMKDKGAKLMIEHPTYPANFARTTSALRRPVFLYTDHVFEKIKPMVDCYAVMGDDCGGTVDGKTAINIVNGVDVESLPLHQTPDNGSEIHLLALASMSYWQGYDRLINAMAQWKGEERFVLHMVGTEGDGSLAQWMQLAKDQGLEEQVVYEGQLHGTALDRMVARCDLGVGGLGLHRRMIKTAISLKLREYMARGLPFMYAVEDVSVPWPERFCVKVSNDDSLVDLKAVRDFVMTVRTTPGFASEMRAYACENMSWQDVLRDVFHKVGIS